MSTKANNTKRLQPNTSQAILNPLRGVYPQKQHGLFMQRIKVFAGRISWRQWRKIAQLAATYSPGSPLHLTTRQDIELHNILANSISALQQGLAEVALPTLTAGGDSVRNITVCTGCPSHTNTPDIFPLAQALSQHLMSQPGILNLPRKFKMSFSACPKACAKPWLNDLGFISQSNGRFTVIVAGSLGPKPTLGIELYNNLLTQDILPLTIAAIQFFAQYGDRENRRKARLRHVREKLGDEVFRAELDTRFRQLKTGKSWPSIPLTPNNNYKRLCRLQLPNGNIAPIQAIQIADAAEPKAAVLRINLEHGLELYGTKPLQLPENLAALEANPIIVACPGSTTCPKALANCWATADNIRKALAGRHIPKTRISISGCPNNCAHSAVADMGLTGLLRRQKGKTAECYRLFTDGGNGRNATLAKQSGIMPAPDVPTSIKRLLDRSKLPDTRD